MGQLSKATSDSYTLKEIEKAIRSRDLLYIYAQHGDMDSVNQIIDADRAIELAKPTAIQLQAIDLVWAKGNTLVNVGNMLGVSPQAVKFNLDLFKVKLKRVLDLWKREGRVG